MSARVIPDRDQLARQAVALRVDGVSYRTIGQRLGVSPMTALTWCRAHIHAHGPRAEQLRAVELGHIDRRLEALAARRTELATTSPGDPGHHTGDTP